MQPLYMMQAEVTLLKRHHLYVRELEQFIHARNLFSLRMGGTSPEGSSDREH